MPNDAPLVDAVALLFTYADMHGKGSSSLKSAFWNISVARRHKGGLGIGASYSATDVREELRAHAVIDCKNEPILDDEDEHEDPKAQKNIDIGEDSYVLRWYDGDSSNKKIDENTADVKISNEFGLRQRKGKDQKTKEKEWSETVYFDEEEDKLRNVDPLELFGALPPRELKIAQTRAKEALESYVIAANKARAILLLIKS